MAEKELSVGTDLRQVTSLFEYEAAALLDSRGRVLQVAPAAPSLMRRNLATRYDHLRAATAGHAAVSNVVPSAAKGIPVVAFATPFKARDGRRVFSGAFDIATTPVGAFLHHVTPLKGARVYLIDAAGLIVASNRNHARGFSRLATADPPLTDALAGSASGTTPSGYAYASERVRGTPWRLVLSVPAARLFQPLRGVGHYVPWVMWGGFVLGALASPCWWPISLSHAACCARRTTASTGSPWSTI